MQARTSEAHFGSTLNLGVDEHARSVHLSRNMIKYAGKFKPAISIVVSILCG